MMNCFSLLCGLTSCLICGAGWLVGADCAIAEVVPDNTLSHPSKGTPAGRRAIITDGTRRGRNLFHSFREFSVAPGETAAFENVDPTVANIFTRVTGNSRSQINGLIEVLGTDGHTSPANLFLLNPNGILFGRDAELRIGGSFIASTADRIHFADDSQFSAVRPQSSHLLTVSAPVGLQFGHHPGPIANRSRTPLLDQAGNQVRDANEDLIFGLVSGSRQTLALVGGNVTLTDGSNIRTEGGRIELGSVASAGEVDLHPIAQGWDITYGQIKDFGDLRLSGKSQVDSSGAPAGEIQLQGRRVILGESFYIFSDSFASSRERGGDLEVVATDSVLIDQTSLLSTSTKGSGRAGDIIISTPQFTVQAGGNVGSNTKAEGRGGDVRVNATESVTVTGFSRETELTSPLSLIFSQSTQSATGRTGNIHIGTNQLTVQDGGQISTTTFGSGNAGNLSIRANQIDLRETAVTPNGKLIESADGIPLSGGLFVGTDIGSSGRGGRLRIQTERLNLRDGAILQATTYGSGVAGNVSIQANQSIEVSGSSAASSQIPARIAATSGGVVGLTTAESRQATGRGGNLTLSTPNLTVSNRGIITVNSANSDSPGAGTIRITADQVQLDHQGQIQAQTESGNRARIDLSDVELLTLRRQSKISTTAGLRNDSGDAGNITIDSDLILAAPSENSDIDADAQVGRGGNITIQSQGILGITQRSQQTIRSDITATSESSVDGEINISTASFDPTQGIVTLPDTVTDASQLIAQGCRAESQAAMSNGNQSAFVITGRGGLPPNPTDLQSGSTVMPHWVTVAPETSRPDHTEQSKPSDDRVSTTSAITEAQGWVVTASGKVALVAQSPTLTPDAAHWNLPNCPSQSRMP